MDFQGKVIQYLGEQSGTSKAGNPWKKKEWVLETLNAQYPRKVKVQCFGDRSDSINLEPGKDYIVYVDLESREFNGRWYTEVSVYRAEELQNQSQGGFQGGYQQPQQNFQAPFGGNQAPFGGNQAPYGGNQPFSPSVGESDEDLPF
ncbi:MAG: DUF3127 domain-containing protein [Muribaculaceae bacterium]|nr:DUF3127 domain-containing protein [Muribaculaceae bacterium]